MIDHIMHKPEQMFFLSIAHISDFGKIEKCPL